MRVSECQGETLRYLSVEPDGYSPRRRYPMVVLLHGYGAQMGDLAGLCPAIDPQGILYICPNAPIPFRIGPGTVGYAWTPSGGGAPKTLVVPRRCWRPWWRRLWRAMGSSQGRWSLEGSPREE